MTLPSVAAVMLVNGREAMARKAIECVAAQTYQNLALIVLDTGQVAALVGGHKAVSVYQWRPDIGNSSIGILRNDVNCIAHHLKYDIIAHFDSDDWSHPRRIEEQVALLEASGAHAVGYNEALFWREPYGQALLYRNDDTSYCLGATLCYWRKTWEYKPFSSISQGEDFRFCLGLYTVGVSSLVDRSAGGLHSSIVVPSFIARIHPANTSNAYSEENIESATEWRMMPDWDNYCRERMAL